MTAVSSPALLRISAAATLPYANLQRMTRPLIETDQWPNRSRRELLASDLGSILNAILGVHATYAGESNATLRALEFKSAWPLDSVQQPMFGVRTWGEMLDAMIENMPLVPDPSVRQAASSYPAGSLHLPHLIESCLNPAGISLTWLGEDGARKRQEFYALPPQQPQSQPYGPATLVVRKTFMSSEMLIIAGQILRDSRAAAARKAKTPNRNAQAKGATPARAAPLRETQDHKTTTIPAANTPENTLAHTRVQASSSRGPVPSRKRASKDRLHGQRPHSTGGPLS